MVRFTEHGLELRVFAQPTVEGGENDYFCDLGVRVGARK